MAALEYKRRVRLPEDFFLDQRSMARRPWPRWPLFVCGWLAFTGLCFAITTDRVPVGAWLTTALEPQAEAAPPPRAPTDPQPPAPAALASPVIAKAEDPAETRSALDVDPAAADQTQSDADETDPEPAIQDDALEEPAHAALEDPGVELPVPPVAEGAATSAATALPSPPDPDDPEPAPASQSSVGTSCEAAVASYQEEIRIGGAAAPPDLSQAQFAAVLDKGSYFAHCGVPDSMSLEICVAVRNGRAVGVTVRTTPGDRRVQGCVARGVRGLSFPAHPRMDVTRTRFESQ